MTSLRLTKTVLTSYNMLYDVDKEHYKAQLKIRQLQAAANQLGFDLETGHLESERWGWGARRGT